MKIENLQVPKGYSKTKSSNSVEPQEEFSKLLSGALTKDSDKTIETTKEPTQTVESDTEVVEVEDLHNNFINPLMMFLNIPLHGDETIDLSLLAENQLEIVNTEIPMNLNLIDTDVMQIENISMPITEISNFDFEAVLAHEDILLEKNIARPESTENIKLDIVTDTELKHNIAKPEVSNKSIPLEDNYNSDNEVKALRVEELNFNEDISIEKPNDEQILEIRNDDSKEVGKWLSHNLDVVQGANITGEVNPQPKVLSNENIQNINDSIIQLMETTTEGNTNIMKVQLYPEELGAVNITLKMEDGKLIAKILVDDDYVKQLFAGKIEQLSNNLIKQNVNMEQIHVELNANSNPNGDSQQKGGNFSNGNRTLNFDGESIERNTIEEAKSDLGVLNILA